MRILTAVVAMLALAGCNKEGIDTDETSLNETYTLMFGGEGYDPHEGQKIAASLEDESGVVVERKEDQSPAQGKFEMAFGGLEDGEYTMYWYADLNEDGDCDPPDADHTWSHAITVAGADLAYTHQHAVDFDITACDHLR